MCVCKDRYNQAGCRQNNHKDLIIAHKHPLLSKLRIWGTTAALLAAWINILFSFFYFPFNQLQTAALVLHDGKTIGDVVIFGRWILENLFVNLQICEVIGINHPVK